MKELLDTDPMPALFKLHAGEPMQDVPVGYLHWLWHNGIQRGKRPEQEQVADYIRRNLNALKLEDRDLIW